MGTGITIAVHRLATITPEEEYGKAPQGMDRMKFSVFKKQMENSILESARETGRGTPNIEDQIRVANDLIRGIAIYLSAQPYGAKKLSKELLKIQRTQNAQAMKASGWSVSLM